MEPRLGAPLLMLCAGAARQGQGAAALDQSARMSTVAAGRARLPARQAQVAEGARGVRRDGQECERARRLVGHKLAGQARQEANQVRTPDPSQRSVPPSCSAAIRFAHLSWVRSPTSCLPPTRLAPRRYAAHDEHDACQVGDIVYISQTRPLSKTKHAVVQFNTGNPAQKRDNVQTVRAPPAPHSTSPLAAGAGAGSTERRRARRRRESLGTSTHAPGCRLPQCQADC